MATGDRLTTRIHAISCLALAAVALALLMATPSPATAHAELVLASPGPGTGVPQPPGAAVITFSEPLNLRLSSIVVLDDSGADVGQGPTLPVEGDPRSMQRKLGLLPVGVYTVRWTTVSTVDGHTLHGSYRFGVGTPTAGESEVRSSPLDSEGPLGLVGRFVALIGLALWIGWAGLRLAATRAGADGAWMDTVARWAPAAAAIGTLLALVSSGLSATGSVTALGGVVASQSGALRLAVVGMGGLAAVTGSRAWPATSVLAVLAVIAEAASGHAAASELAPVAIGSFALHLAAAGVWVFAVATALLGHVSVRTALAAFSPYAIAAAVVTGATGLANAALELATPTDLIETGYGLGVIGKSVTFAAMAGLGAWHFFARRRATATDRHLRRPVRAEAAAAVVAVALATILVAIPAPPRQGEAAEALAHDGLHLAELVEGEALSLAAADRDLVVGITLSPPRPGQVEVWVTVVGVEAGDALRDAVVRMNAASGSVESQLEPCGPGCFRGSIEIDDAGDWTAEVSFESSAGPRAVRIQLPLPAPDGSEDLTRAIEAMEGLSSAHLEERLAGATDGPLLEARYRFAAPDRMSLEVDESQRIIIGEEGFRRSAPSESWEASSFPGFEWPRGYYASFWSDSAAVRVVGSESIDGVPSQIIAFVRPDLPAWFKLWVGDEDGLVRRQEMRAEGHLMDHTYRGFNDPITIERPQR